MTACERCEHTHGMGCKECIQEGDKPLADVQHHQLKQQKMIWIGSGEDSYASQIPTYVV